MRIFGSFLSQKCRVTQKNGGTGWGRTTAPKVRVVPGLENQSGTKKWWYWVGSNHRPRAYESNALTS